MDNEIAEKLTRAVTLLAAIRIKEHSSTDFVDVLEEVENVVKTGEYKSNGLDEDFVSFGGLWDK